MPNPGQLVSYIAPAAPATRRISTGNEAFLRPEIGFTPNWYHLELGIDFGKRWHTEPAYRRDTILLMKNELKLRFPETAIGQLRQTDSTLDILTGTFGTCTIAGIYHIPIRYAKDNWPVCEKYYLSDKEVDYLLPPDLEQNTFFQQLMRQVDWIAEQEGMIVGFINWQGVLNNAHRLRGEQLFFDIFEYPKRARHLFECVFRTMVETAQRLYQRQKNSGHIVNFFTVSNCLVNMISAEVYKTFLFPLDKQFAKIFGCLGIHNCAWNANPYLDAYSKISPLGYIDMGIESDLKKARRLFPHTRRAIMYTPMDLLKKAIPQIRSDLEKIARDYGPCDIVAADIEYGTDDSKIIEFLQLCQDIGESFQIQKS